MALFRLISNNKFLRIKECVIQNITNNIVSSLVTTKGDTQVKERLSINFMKNCLDKLDYYYEEAGSQQSKDFRNICKINLNIER